jgi:hypothetical protein
VIERIAAALCVLASAATARAYHDERHRATDETAYTLPSGSVRVGVFKLQVGLFDFVTVGTYTLPWAVLAATGHGKLRLMQADPVALAVQAGFAYFDSSRLRVLDDAAGSAIVTAFPLEGLASYRFNHVFTLSAGVVYTEVGVSGTLAIDAFDGAAAGAADNLQLTSTAELRLSRVFALTVHGRWLVLQRVAGNALASYQPDAFTSVVVHGDVGASSFGVRDAFSIVPSLHVSWGVFNLRLGLGYGNFNVPLLNFVLPDPSLIPEFDLYLVL